MRRVQSLYWSIDVFCWHDCLARASTESETWLRASSAVCIRTPEQPAAPKEMSKTLKSLNLIFINVREICSKMEQC